MSTATTLFDAAIRRAVDDGVRSFHVGREEVPELDYTDAGRELYERLACFQRKHGEEYADVAWQYLPKVQQQIFQATALSFIEWSEIGAPEKKA